MSESSISKGFGMCLGGCLFIIVLAVAIPSCGVVGLLGLASMSPDSPENRDAVVVKGTTGRCRLTIISNYTLQLAGETVAEKIYTVATAHPELTEVDVEIELNVPGGGLEDHYGHSVPGPYIMGTVSSMDLSEARKYASAGAYGIELQDAYAAKIVNLSYANQLKQE